MARVLLPLPDTDFDVTEVAVPWKLLTEAGHEVVFSTEHGTVPTADPLLLTGVLFGQLGAEPEPKRFYAEMLPTMAPITWDAVDASYDALLLPGGHAPGMRQYLGSALLQQRIRDFWDTGKPIAAICHGVLPLARAGVLKGVRTTCLPKYMERSAYLSTAWLRGRYYRTYPAYVEDEVRASGAVFEKGPRVLNRRGTRTEHSAAFTVRDGRYLSARWPGDAYLFAQQLLEMLP